MDCSLPGSSVHGIFQAGVLEWGAIAFTRSHILPQARETKDKENLLSDFPDGSVDRNLPADAGDTGSIPGLG